MGSEKAIGYVLLLLGIGIILFAVFNSLSVFNSSSKPPELFKIEKSSSQTMTVGGIEIPSMEIIPIDYLNLSGNLTFFLLFMFLVVSAGGRIASIGVGMISIKESPKT